MQIHREIAAKRVVLGWVLPRDGLVEREISSTVGETLGRDPGDDVLTLRDGHYWVIPLNQRLSYPHPSKIINGDEKPIIPDNPLLTRIGLALSYGRSGSWTIVIYTSADGKILSYTIILRGIAITQKMKDIAERNGILLVSEKKGSQTDRTFPLDLEHMIRKLKPTREQPALLIVDGHCTRLTSSVRKLLMSNNVYGIVLPSHMTTILQALDNGVNALIEDGYKHEYTAKVTSLIHQDKKKFTAYHRIKLIIRSMCKIMSQDEKTIQHGWRIVGLPSGVVNTNEINPKKFSEGSQYRGKTLPGKSYFSFLFQPKELSKPFGSAFTLENGEAFQLEDIRKEYFLNSFFCPTPNPESTAIITRFEYKLGNASSQDEVVNLMFERYTSNAEDPDRGTELPAKKGASGKPSTMSAVILYGTRYHTLLTESERRAGEAKAIRQRAKENQIRRVLEEAPITLALQQEQIISSDQTKILKPHLLNFWALHKDEQWPQPFKKNESRYNMLEAIRSFLLKSSTTPSMTTAAPTTTIIATQQQSSSSPSPSLSTTTETPTSSTPTSSITPSCNVARRSKQPRRELASIASLPALSQHVAVSFSHPAPVVISRGSSVFSSLSPHLTPRAPLSEDLTPESHISSLELSDSQAFLVPTFEAPSTPWEKLLSECFQCHRQAENGEMRTCIDEGCDRKVCQDCVSDFLWSCKNNLNPLTHDTEPRRSKRTRRR